MKESESTNTEEKKKYDKVKKAVKVASAIIVLGIVPFGTTALLSYGAYKAYKKIKHQRP